jgi:hypothetical protein
MDGKTRRAANAGTRTRFIKDSGRRTDIIVMTGLDPAIHVLFPYHLKTGMPGTRPGMTINWQCES